MCTTIVYVFLLFVLKRDNRITVQLSVDNKGASFRLIRRLLNNSF